MAFTKEQVALLHAPLQASSVKQREQSGRKFSYIEGWHAIAEANRIFGFDGWQRETIDLKCVSEKERTVGANKASGWGVTYSAKVRITVGYASDQIIREGCGTGHGVDRDLGQAHESALKEAETDAMKRALMTFGNPFGLALYDKEQRGVSNEPPPRAPVKPRMSAAEWTDKAVAEIAGMERVRDLEDWGANNAAAMEALSGRDPDQFDRLSAAIKTTEAALSAEGKQ